VWKGEILACIAVPGCIIHTLGAAWLTIEEANGVDSLLFFSASTTTCSTMMKSRQDEKPVI
jgi:hypothetical protein